MTPAPQVEYLQPLPTIEEELCGALAGQEIPAVALREENYTTAISGSKVEWRVIRPEDLTTLKDDRPVVVENGLMGSEEAYEEFAQKLASLGYIVLTKKPPRKQRLDVALRPHNIVDPMELQAKASWAVMRDYMRRYPRDDAAIQKFHIVCHSMGGPVGADTAEHHPEHTASLTLIGSAGLEKHHTPVLAKRLFEVIGHEILPAFILPGRITNEKLAAESLKHFTGSFNRVAREAIQVSNYYTVPALRRLRELGIPIYDIQPAHDHFFPFRKQLGAAALFDRFIKLNVGRADHLCPQTQAALVALIFDNLVKPAASASESPIALAQA